MVDVKYTVSPWKFRFCVTGAEIAGRGRVLLEVGISDRRVAFEHDVRPLNTGALGKPRFDRFIKHRFGEINFEIADGAFEQASYAQNLSLAAVFLLPPDRLQAFKDVDGVVLVEGDRDFRRCRTQIRNLSNHLNAFSRLPVIS